MCRVRTHASGFVVQSQVLGRELRHTGTGESRLVHALAHRDRLGRCPRAFVPPQPLTPTISSSGCYPQLMDELCSVAISFLLLGLSVLGSLPIQTPADPRAGLSESSAWNVVGAGQGLGASGALPKQEDRGGTRACCRDHAGEMFPSPGCTLPCVVLAERGCGAACGAAGQGWHRGSGD